MTAHRKLTVKAQGPDAQATFYVKACRGKAWITVYACPHVCVAILVPAQADRLVELITETATEARGHKNGTAS